MNRNEFKKKLAEIYVSANIIETNFDAIDELDFTGIYILCETDEVVYIGSSYSMARKLKARLKNHITAKISKDGKSHSSFLDHIIKQKGNIDKAIEYIKSLSIYAIQYQDLEQKLIELAKPKYNRIHNKKTER